MATTSQRPRRSKRASRPEPYTAPISTASQSSVKSLPRAKLILFGAAAVSLTVFGSLVLVEFAMRAFGIVPPRHERPKTVVLQGGIDMPERPGDKLVKTTSRLKHLGVDMGEYVPNTVFKTIYDANLRGYFDKEGGVLSEINALGMRGPNAAAEKTTGTFRILGIGDSFTYGAGVRDEDTFLRRLERSLNQQSKPSDIQRYEVLNAGVEGYNTRDEIITLEHRWLTLKPDLILIGFYLNDCYSDFTFLNRGEAQAVNKPKPPGLAQWSYLWDYVQHKWTAYQESRNIQKFYQEQVFARPDQFLENPGDKQVDWSTSRAALARAAELARHENTRIALVIFPELYSLNENYPFRAIHEHVANACRELGIPVLDLFESFRGHDEEELWVHPADHHPNEIGHHIAAEAIEKFLHEQGFLRPS